ncbi:hypothetical protein VP01_1919g4 [Puccinia sorghi]|uniref:Uncharacterized protein n=1 Tax=Puccinia sorghi TaxID=27349 RepID=A0A0L6VCN4_9BASI|nr:hypothetical protein VP01_1919g4 [Puccinia sorghi]
MKGRVEISTLTLAHFPSSASSVAWVALTGHDPQKNVWEGQLHQPDWPLPISFPCLPWQCAVCKNTHSQDTALALWRIRVLLAMSLDGMVAVMAQTGSILQVDMESFLEFVLTSLFISPFEFGANAMTQLPIMGEFPGPNSVLVMDTEQVHHGGWINKLHKVTNVMLVFLPTWT